MLLLSLAAFSFFGNETVTASAPTVYGMNAPAPAEEQAREKVIVLVVDALPLSAFARPSSSHLRAAVAENGVIGLMSTRTAAGPHGSAAAHATIGAGVRIRTGAETTLVLGAGETRGGQTGAALFESLTGTATDGAAVVVPGVAALRTEAAASTTPVVPGALGETVVRSGSDVAVIGNADVDGQRRRHAALIGMDYAGRVAFGAVDERLLVADDAWPFGRRTDYDATWAVFTELFPTARLIVVELGDMARLDAHTSLLDANQRQILVAQTMERVDEFIGRLMSWPPARGHTVLFVSPSPPAAAMHRGHLLAPFARWHVGPPSAAVTNPENASPFLATSATTRRAGIVTNTDVTSTALAHLGLTPVGPIPGQRIDGVDLIALQADLPATARRPEDAWAALELLYERATVTNSLRAPVVRSFIGLAIGVFVAIGGWTVYARFGRQSPYAPQFVAAGRWLLLLLLATPLTVFVAPLLPPGGLSSTLTMLPIGAALVATLAFAFRPAAGLDAFIALSLVTAVALLLDVIAGAPLIKSSVFGYDPIVAARFYGIGNEYVGVLIGTVLVGTTGGLDKLPPERQARGRTFLLVAYAVIVAIVASPSFGANVGGTIAAVAGFGVTASSWRARTVSWKTPLLLAGTVLIVLAGAAAFDVLGRAETSHVGRAAATLLAGDWAALQTIIARKFAMSLRLLRWTIWAQVFVVSLAISAVALFRPTRPMDTIKKDHPHLILGLRGAVVSGLVALVVNDSGVVAAAMMMIPVTAVSLYLMLRHRASSRTPEV